ncbi:MAG: Translation initiation factor 2 subunit alpha [Promethearchaeota archaeon]|nr:MAG: Translation initiation factor 2 subunit alpha [Candidatus Lokiarchaeota archaeon]
MPKSRSKFPSEGDFVVSRVSDIQDQYVYVDLLDYEGLPYEKNARGMIHISEISSRWVKNIRNHLREGQKVVLRVVRVDPEKGHVDLSLRRTNSAQRENKMRDWKYAVKLENILQFLIEEHQDMTLDEAYEKIGFPILEYFNDDYQETVEALKENGEEILNNLTDIPENVQESFLAIVEENVEISKISILGKLKLRFIQENGVELIKETLLAAGKVIEDPKETRKVELSYIAAPFYRVEVISKDYLDAESILSKLLSIIEESAKKYDATFEFIRD